MRLRLHQDQSDTPRRSTDRSLVALRDAMRDPRSDMDRVLDVVVDRIFDELTHERHDPEPDRAAASPDIVSFPYPGRDAVASSDRNDRRP
jgi:hypothetical protein